MPTVSIPAAVNVVEGCNSAETYTAIVVTAPSLNTPYAHVKAISLLLLRVSLGLLMLIWGIDKLINADHAVAVSKTFYLSVLAQPAFQQGLGVLQCLLALAIVVGFWCRYTYPVLAVITGITLLAVWRSILDPLGLYLGEGTNLLFFPSFTVFAGALVLLAFQAEDRYSVDASRV